MFKITPDQALQGQNLLHSLYGHKLMFYTCYTTRSPRIDMRLLVIMFFSYLISHYIHELALVHDILDKSIEKAGRAPLVEPEEYLFKPP